MLAVATRQGDADDGQWLELTERFRFTFAGLFISAVSFRCLTLQRSLGQPPYPVSPSLFRLLPAGARGLHICLQTISRRLPRLSPLGSGIRYVPVQGTRYFIDLNDTFEAYIAKFGAKTRETMRRKIRRFTQGSNSRVPWREFRSAEDMAEFNSLAGEVSAKTYQHRLLHAGLDPSPSFWQELVRDAAVNRVRGYVLFYQQMPIAYMFCRTRCSDLVVETMGFDPSFAAYSPGLVLFWFVLQRLLAGHEFRFLDLGEGAYPYKAHLATGSIEVAEIYCFPWNPKNVVLVVAHSAVSAAAALLKCTLEILGVGRRLKKFIRGEASRVGVK
jgi:CelD/BcsL family acetyltransferase involved in cellulose biosynthesis